MIPAGLMERFRQMQQQRDTGLVNNAARQPIPGLTGPLGSGAGIPGFGMAPPQQQPLPAPNMGNHMLTGPYGQQALQLAGLLGSRRAGIPPLPYGGAQINSLLGSKAQSPFYRPVGK